MKHNERNAGRKKLPPERKKNTYNVYLIPGEAERLIERFGSLSLAIRSLIINDGKELDI